MILRRTLASWLAYRRLFAGPALFQHRHDPELQRAIQRRAAREAWLSDLPAGERRLAQPTYGDIQ